MLWYFLFLYVKNCCLCWKLCGVNEMFKLYWFVDMGGTYYVVLLRYRGWSISFERDTDRYQLIDLVRVANKFLSQPPVDRKPKFFGLSSHSPQKARLNGLLILMMTCWKYFTRRSVTSLNSNFISYLLTFILRGSGA